MSSATLQYPSSGPSLYHVIARNSTIRWSIVLYVLFKVVIRVNPILPWIWYSTTHPQVLDYQSLKPLESKWLFLHSFMVGCSTSITFVLDCNVGIRWSWSIVYQDTFGFFKYHNTCRSLPCLATLIPVTWRHLGCQVSSIMSTVIRYQVESSIQLTPPFVFVWVNTWLICRDIFPPSIWSAVVPSRRQCQGGPPYCHGIQVILEYMIEVHGCYQMSGGESQTDWVVISRQVQVPFEYPFDPDTYTWKVDAESSFGVIQGHCHYWTWNVQPSMMYCLNDHAMLSPSLCWNWSSSRTHDVYYYPQIIYSTFLGP